MQCLLPFAARTKRREHSWGKFSASGVDGVSVYSVMFQTGRFGMNQKSNSLTAEMKYRR